MLLSLLLANKAIVICLFLFLPIVFRIILTIPLLIRNTKLIRALVIPKCVPITVVNELWKIPRFAPDKASKVLSYTYWVSCSPSLYHWFQQWKNLLFLVSIEPKSYKVIWLKKNLFGVTHAIHSSLCSIS